MLSLQLRSTAPHNRREMLKLIIDQLEGIGGSRSVGFGNGRVLSLPDAIAGALREHYMSDDTPQQLGLPMESPALLAPPTAEEHPHELPTGAIPGADLCPECGTAALVRAEGCRKCMVCGYSEC
jgi:ribonucleoside-diphosphate reductase alpha chain